MINSLNFKVINLELIFFNFGVCIFGGRNYVSGVGIGDVRVGNMIVLIDF